MPVIFVVAAAGSGSRAPSSAARSTASPTIATDSTAMRLDDLPRDGQPEPGILSEALLRPVGVEAVEDFFERIGSNARTVIVDHDLDLVAQPPADHPNVAGLRRERARVVDQIVQ